MGLNFDYQDGQTPLDEDEKDGLLLQGVSTKGELDEVEQQNIEQAVRWTIERRKKITVNEVLSEAFVLQLHKRMFGAVWQWAGTFRKTNKNIGVDKYEITTELRQLLDDCKYWIDHNTFSADEIAVRFSHRIVSIHCFANGNGRHSRLIADIIVEKLFDREPFSWGSKGLVKNGDERARYLAALKQADNGEYEALIAFAHG